MFTQTSLFSASTYCVILYFSILGDIRETASSTFSLVAVVWHLKASHSLSWGTHKIILA